MASNGKANFPSNLNCGQKNVSETGPMLYIGAANVGSVVDNYVFSYYIYTNILTNNSGLPGPYSLQVVI